MKQIVHIFLKDVRHFWVEIVIAEALVVVQFWLGRYQWLIQGPVRGYTAGGSLQILSSALSLLTPIVLVLLIARSVQDEGLVGDRQFWLTRPYAWGKLLAAKLLLFAVFIYIPFFILQIVLLAEAGFSPFPWVPRIVLNLVLVTAVILLPLMAIASVTSSFGRMVLVLVGVLLLELITSGVAALTGRYHAPSHTAPLQVADLINAVLFLLVFGAVIALQYGRRRVLESRLLLACVFALSFVISVFGPDRLLVNRNYPAASSQSIAPLELSFNSNLGGAVSYPGWNPRIVSVSLALRVSGVPIGSAISLDEIKAEFETASGLHWVSGWQEEGMWIGEENGLTVERLSFSMPQKVYDRLKNVPSKLTLTLALTDVKGGKSIEIPLPKTMQEFTVPGLAICTPQEGFEGDAAALACRFPFQAPLTQVSSRTFDEPCAQRHEDLGVETSGWFGSLDNHAPEITLVPVRYPSFPLPMGLRQTEKGRGMGNYCPGTPVTFTHFELARRMQTTITAEGFQIQ